MCGQGGADDVREGPEFDAGVHPFRVLPENNQVDAFFIIERIARIGFAGTKIGEKVELLAETDDRTEIGQAFAPK
jgi:hypothetical protein